MNRGAIVVSGKIRGGIWCSWHAGDALSDFLAMGDLCLHVEAANSIRRDERDASHGVVLDVPRTGLVFNCNIGVA